MVYAIDYTGTLWECGTYPTNNTGLPGANSSVLKSYTIAGTPQLTLFWNFTGQHRCFVKNYNYTSLKSIEGLIVCANNDKYVSDIDTNFNMNDTTSITTNDALPLVSLCEKANDKSVFGVVSLKTEYAPGMNPTTSELEKCREQGDVRAEINAIGEGSMWVSDTNGPIETGDYITSSQIIGYGQKQNDDLLHNYTVAKSTMNCDFSCPLIPETQIRQDIYGNNILDSNGWPIWDVVMVPNIVVTDVTSDNINNNLITTDSSDSATIPKMIPKYEMRYLLGLDGTQITKDMYDSHIANGVTVYRAVFMGVTYHCG